MTTEDELEERLDRLLEKNRKEVKEALQTVGKRKDKKGGDEK